MNTCVRTSIVVPLYNEEATIEPFLAELDAVIKELEEPAEAILVDDGSTDHSFALLRAAQKRYSWLRVIRFGKNAGQTQAMAAGFEAVRGKRVVTLDADLQNDPRDIPKLIAKLSEGYDLVCGWRKERADATLTRLLPSKIANWLIGKLTGVRFHDYGCTLKAYNSKLLGQISLYSDLHRFIPALGGYAGARTAETAVLHRPRTLGQSKYGLSRIWKVWWDMLTLATLLRFSQSPGHWFVFVAFVPGTLGILLGLYCLVGYLGGLLIPITLPGICTLLIFLSAGLLLQGMLGELLVSRRFPGSAHVLFEED
jgi:glycosyltransferase involved in cell wall biosynthesis